MGVRTIKTPWASASNSYTEGFERWPINLLQATKNQTKTAKLLRCKFDTFNRILHRSEARGLKRGSLDGIAHLSVDEKDFQRGHSYAPLSVMRRVAWSLILGKVGQIEHKNAVTLSSGREKGDDHDGYVEGLRDHVPGMIPQGLSDPRSFSFYPVPQQRD